ncbi:MAG: EpsG family protein [Muribaculaceae bacterium]|nr:EpsG family protein [Muribaculaceae bacterium]
MAILLWILAKFEVKDCEGKQLRIQQQFWTWENIATILLFGAFYGVRYNVGPDNLMYIKIYEAFANGHVFREDDLEAGYKFAQQLFNGLNLHYSIFIGFWGALQIGFVYYAMRRYKYLLPFMSLFIILGPPFLTWANIMRQAVVECAFILFVEFIVERKMWKYLIGVLLCTLIHKSAFLLIPFYFLLQRPVFPRKWWVSVIIVAVCTAIGSTPTFVEKLGFIDDVLKFLDYNQYQFDEVLKDSDNFRAWGPARAGVWALSILCCGLYPYLRSTFRFNKQFDIYFCCFFFGTCLYELFANTQQIFIRPLAYFRDCMVVVVPICLYYITKTNIKPLFLLLFLLACFNSIWWTVKAYLSGAGEKAFEVYKFFFLQ